MVNTTLDAATAGQVAAGVPDPELPMVTIGQLGILREVDVDDRRVVVTITPTYSGCPAMREIAADVRHRLERAGFADVTVRTRLSPPWTTDWISDDGRRALAEHGVAPPHPVRPGPIRLNLGPRVERVRCPLCGSTDTAVTAQFSGTACKALYRCGRCREPFEYVKPI
jgi:ring-1,2-phenylacetyl-CoA epoxidase subunit PaaD